MNSTKSILRRTTMLVLVTLCWCGCTSQQNAQYQSANTSPSESTAQPKTQPTEDPQTTLNREAESFFSAEFKKHFADCGDSYYSRFSVGSSIRQFKGAHRSSVIPESVREVDRLNGVEYYGTVKLYSKFGRDHSGKWGRWWPEKENKPTDVFSVKKVKGRWSTDLRGGALNWTAIKCSEIPSED